MKTIHVGGMNPFNRCKTLSDAIKKAKDDDTIELHKNIEATVQIDKNIIIEGNNHTITVPSGKMGFNCQLPIEISNLNFKVNTRANAIVTHSNLTLSHVNTEIIGPVREFYPLIRIANPENGNHIKADIADCELQMLNIDSAVNATIEHCVLGSYYPGNVMLGSREDMNRIMGNVTIKNSTLRSTILGASYTQDNQTYLYGNANCYKCLIQQYVDVDSQASFNDCYFECINRPVNNKAFKNEPTNGPLSNQTESRYGLAIRPGASAVINQYDVDAADKEFLGIYANQAELTIENVNQPKNQITNKTINTTLSFKNAHDQNFWDINDGTMAFVRSEVNSNANYETAVQKLNSLIGQDTVKDQIKSIMNTIEVNQNNQDKNFSFSYNMIFAGNPGTGKTTFAEIVAQALFEIGAIPQNKFTSATSDEFVKGYVGQTGENTRKILDRALGGVLFIDEAYELTVRDNEKSYNSEVISVLIRYMEDHRSDLVVIAAGYNKEMKEFLASNVGLDRRFQWIQFEDYTNEQMGAIFDAMRKSYHDEYAQAELSQLIVPLFKRLTDTNLSIPDAKGRTNNGGNGGLVRNVYQAIAQAKNNRIVEHPDQTKALTQEDIAIGFQSQINKALQRKL